ncbi:dedicator of cytokinesis protein 1-like [Tubulanus polymorphus]|uniref:dedicator of cytokinesis protein 1-like n=1 Tax=Tubulanus polymorphus TaxID=672921 RepID=UPI003DA6B99F
MTKWLKACNERKYAVAIYSYNDDQPHRLPLNIGDVVHILEENANWYRGYNIRNKHVKGIFPKEYIHIRQNVLNKPGTAELVYLSEPPIIQEITSVLWEWEKILKDLYLTHNRHFDVVRKFMLELIDQRKLIMSRKLPMDEVKSLQQKMTAKIDMGNALLGLDLVVRDEQGNILDPSRTGCIQLYRQHEAGALRVQRAKSIEPPYRTLGNKHSFSLLVSVRNFVCRIGEDADVLMSLYDCKQNRYISENYIVKWGGKGLPKDIEMLNNLRVLFTDLGHRDLERGKVFLICQIIRIGCMNLKEHSERKLAQGLRRPFGVAAMDITEIIMGKVRTDEETQFFVPFQQCGEREFLDSVVKKVISVKEGAINHKGQGLWISALRLPGDLEQVKEEQPHLIIGSTVISRKLGFPEVILPGDIRNDIYVTIVQGEFTKGNKTSDRNVEVIMSVCDKSGSIISSVVMMGAGCPPHCEYRSVIYYHEDRPKWYETVKVALPIDDFSASHLRFLFRHRSTNEAKDRTERPFALAYVKLKKSDGTTLADGLHNLLVYKIESKKLDDCWKAYQSLPSTRLDLDTVLSNNTNSKPHIGHGPLTLSQKDSFQISSLVCSTKLTQNVDLRGLLNWRDNPTGLEHHLKAIMKVDGEEIIKFLQDTLDALFNILQNSDCDQYDNLVFDALVMIIGLTSDHKYNQFKPVLEVYIKNDFSATLVYPKLINTLRFYVERAGETEYLEPLLKTLKSYEFLMKFILRSRVLFVALNEGLGQQQFQTSVVQLLTSLNIMMMIKTERTRLVQAAAMKYIPSAIPDLMQMLDVNELSNLIVNFVNNVASNSLIKQKLQCIKDIVHSEIFREPTSRSVLLPALLDHVKMSLESYEETELCIVILGDILDLMYRNETGVLHEDLASILRIMLSTVIKTVIQLDIEKESSLVRNCVAVLTAMFHQMTETHYQEYITNMAGTREVMDFLVKVLLVFRELVKRVYYPNDWNEMIMLQNSVILKALRFFSHTLKDRFSEPFEYQLWNNFFHCSISFLTQESLQLENFTALKQSKIISRYKDMRREAGFEIRSIWFNLGPNKTLFIPGMVGPILEMTLIPEIELRKHTIPIFFDMMHNEFLQIEKLRGGGTKYKSNFKEVENEIITQLDVLVEGGRGDEQYRDLFYNIMRGYFENQQSMKEQGVIFVATIQQLLQHLLEYRSVINDDSKENKMSCIVNLLNFYHDINRQEMYIRYLHKLCDLHLECDNYTEAAYTLMLYAKLLQWSDTLLSSVLCSNKYPEAHTHRELKQKLYYEMIHYFNKGKMWEKGVEICKELINQYESETFDYDQLSDLLTQQAQFYKKIITEMRPEPEYFRVGFYGKGFPSFLENKVYVFRGKEYERLSDFAVRLQNQFPNSQLLKTLTTPGDEIMESSEQHLQVNAVTPMLELKSKFINKKVKDQILKYYKVNEVQKFTFSRRIDKGSGDVANMWLERTNMVTSYPLPGILRWFPVTSTHVSLVSPLEVAIETIDAANEKLRGLIEVTQSDLKMRVDPLGMVLNGIVDPAVSGGISMYKVFYEDSYMHENPGKTTFQLVQRLREATAKQIQLLCNGLQIHSQRVSPTMQPLHDHMVESYNLMKNLVETEYGIRVKTQEITVKRAKTLLSPSPVQDLDNRSSAIRRSGFGPRRFSSSKFYSLRPSGSVGNLSVGTSKVESETPQKGGSPSSQRTLSSSVWVRPGSSTVSRSVSTVSKSRGTLINVVSNVTQAFSKRPLSTEITHHGDKPSKDEKKDDKEEEKVLNNSHSHSRGDISKMIELTEELTPQRPRRPDPEKRNSQRHSRQFSLNLSTSTEPSTPSSTSGSQESLPLTEECPPPLPVKTQYADYSNINIIPPTDSPSDNKRMTSFILRKDKPVPPLPISEPPPALPGKHTTTAPVSPQGTPPALPKKNRRTMKT